MPSHEPRPRPSSSAGRAPCPSPSSRRTPSVAPCGSLPPSSSRPMPGGCLRRSVPRTGTLAASPSREDRASLARVVRPRLLRPREDPAHEGVRARGRVVIQRQKEAENVARALRLSRLLRSVGREPFELRVRSNVRRRRSQRVPQHVERGIGQILLTLRLPDVVVVDL